MLVTVLMVAAVWLPVLSFFGDIAGSLTNDAGTLRLAVVAFGILVLPYVLFSFNTVTDSVFYGIGKTRYMAFQSIITNGTVYLIAFAPLRGRRVGAYIRKCHVVILLRDCSRLWPDHALLVEGVVRQGRAAGSTGQSKRRLAANCFKKRSTNNSDWIRRL